jgi:tetratricopeptide (TPR) repeat protein
VSALAEKLALSEQDRADEEHLFATIKRWLHNQTGWLLVLDHLDDLTLIDLIVPSQGNGHILLTTRTKTAGEIASAIPITPMDTAASVLFLLHRAGVIPVRASLDQAPPAAIQQATAIAQELDGFPLALDQAGAYLEETGCGLETYLDLFQEERAALLGRRGRVVSNQNHPDSVAITLTLAIAQVVWQRATNLPLLRLLAFLHPDAIPYELLVDGASELNEQLRSLAARPLALNEALADLYSYSLIHHLTDTTTLSIHRIVQAVLIDALTKRQQRQWASMAIRMVNRVFPEVHFDTHEERALLICEQALGPDHPDVALFLNNLAFLADKQGQYQQAEPLYQRALSIYEQALGADHPLVADVLNNLGVLYRDTDNEERAEPLLRRALAIREQALGPTHPDTAQSLSNLADLLAAQHAYQDAEELFQQALALRLQAFGPTHPDVARTREKYASLLERMNRNEEATMLRQAAQIHEEPPSTEPSQDDH